MGKHMKTRHHLVGIATYVWKRSSVCNTCPVFFVEINRTNFKQRCSKQEKSKTQAKHPKSGDCQWTWSQNQWYSSSRYYLPDHGVNHQACSLPPQGLLRWGPMLSDCGVLIAWKIRGHTQTLMVRHHTCNFRMATIVSINHVQTQPHAICGWDLF